MPAWLTLMIIVLVSLAVFADLRRSDTDDASAASEHEELSTAPGAVLRPNVRDTTHNGHPSGVPRPLPAARRTGRDVRKRS
jgi:hypothetical protein